MENKQAKKQPKSKATTLAASDTKNIEKKLTNAEIRERLLNLHTGTDPKRWNNAALEQILNQTGEKPSDEATTAVMTLGFDNDYVLNYTVSKWYSGLVIELRRKLIKDFDCKTHAEKALVDMAVSGYMRVIRASQSLTGNLDYGSISPVRNQCMAIMSKEIDRAHRHFTTAYQILLQLKQPPLNVQVHANSAFVAQAQQFNMNDLKGKESGEIISSK